MKLDMKHGWLLPELLRLDDEYQGRYEIWRYTLKTGEHTIEIPQTKFLSFIDDGFRQGAEMMRACTEAIWLYGAGSLHSSLDFMVDWLLYAFGHPIAPQPPNEAMGMKSANRKLAREFDLELLMQLPGDYFGHLLAGGVNKRWDNFYPTLQSVANTMVDAGALAMRVRSGIEPPYHGYDPALGTGRLALPLSNYCRSLTAWERNRSLMRMALVNFCLYAPDFAYPLPGMGGDLIVGDTLSGKGHSLLRDREVEIDMQVPEFALEPLPERKSNKPADIVIEGTDVRLQKTKSGKSGEVQISLF